MSPLLTTAGTDATTADFMQWNNHLKIASKILSKD